MYHFSGWCMKLAKSFPWSCKIPVHVSQAMMVESEEVFLGRPPCFSDVHSLVPRTFIFRSSLAPPAFSWGPSRACCYAGKESEALCSSDPKYVRGRGDIFPFTRSPQPISFPNVFHFNFAKPGSSLFYLPVETPPLPQSIFTIFHKEPPWCIVVGMLFFEALYFTGQFWP